MNIEEARTNGEPCKRVGCEWYDTDAEQHCGAERGGEPYIATCPRYIPESAITEPAASAYKERQEAAEKLGYTVTYQSPYHWVDGKDMCVEDDDLAILIAWEIMKRMGWGFYETGRGAWIILRGSPEEDVIVTERDELADTIISAWLKDEAIGGR